MNPPDPKKRKIVENRERVGLVLVHTGDGKGKSTSAFGLALRGVGHGMKVVIVQFIKGNRDPAELGCLERLGVQIIRAGEGFTWEVRNDTRQQELARWGFERAQEALDQGADILILDEVNIVLGKGFLPLDDVLGLLRARRPEVHVVCTGRHAPDGLIDAADLVTRHELVKHPFQRGIKAQAGVEF